MGTAPELHVVEAELSAQLATNRPALIPPGIYEATLVKRCLRNVNCAKKLELHFQITTFGDHFGKVIPCFYNVQDFSKRKGTFKVGWKSRFAREYARLFPRPQNAKNLSTGLLVGKIVRMHVKTVTHDSRQRAIPEGLQYSVVEELLELAGP